MNHLLCLILFVMWLVPCNADPTEKIDGPFTKKLEAIIKEVDAIKPGQTRKDLLKLFDGEGGLYSGNERRYDYRTCPYIKIDVKFERNPIGPEKDDDKIVSISKPYLDLSIVTD